LLERGSRGRTLASRARRPRDDKGALGLAWGVGFGVLVGCGAVAPTEAAAPGADESDPSCEHVCCTPPAEGRGDPSFQCAEASVVCVLPNSACQSSASSPATTTSTGPDTPDASPAPVESPPGTPGDGDASADAPVEAAPLLTGPEVASSQQVAAAIAACSVQHGTVNRYASDSQLQGLLVGTWWCCSGSDFQTENGCDAPGMQFRADGTFAELGLDAQGGLGANTGVATTGNWTFENGNFTPNGSFTYPMFAAEGWSNGDSGGDWLYFEANPTRLDLNGPGGDNFYVPLMP